MIAGGSSELVMWQRRAELSRDAERDRCARLVISGRGGKARRTRSARWDGWAGRIRAVLGRLLQGPSSGRPELLTRGDES
jgi:hypothetical protein